MTTAAIRSTVLRWCKGPFHRVELAFLRMARRERLSVDTYAFLVTSLFGTMIGYLSLVGAGAILTAARLEAKPSLTTALLFAAMCVIAILRVALVVLFRRWQAARKGALGARHVREICRWEAIYAIVGIAMMAVIGMSTANATLDQTDVLSLVVAIMVTIGIAGCIPGRNGSRPAIVACQVAAACLPFVAALLFVGTRPTTAVAALTLIFFAAAMSSTKAQYLSLKTTIQNEARARSLARSVRQTALRLDSALNSMSSGLLMFNDSLRLVIANDRVKAMWGHGLVDGLLNGDANDVGEALFAALRTPDEEAAVVRQKVRAILARGTEQVAILTDRTHGRIYDLNFTSAEGGGIVVIVDDTTEKRRKDQEIYRLAHRDSLTGMANRFDLSQQMGAMIARATSASPVVAMYIDLDGFKAVNDYFGHPVGDALLVRVAERISDHTRRSDLVARIGGDEFVVCFQDAYDFETISAMARRLIDEISRPYAVDGKTIEIGASAGLAAAHTDTGSPEEVLRLADVALYEAKTNGRGRAIWFAAEMDDRARKHREMTLELRAAIDAGELTLAYQPVVDFRSGRIVCCEALARWTSPTRGVVPPSVFIPLAEATDLIHRLGDWSLRRACADAATWPDPTIKVAVNLSAAQFKHPQIAKRVTEIVEQSPLAPSRLEIEITETTLAEDLNAMKVEMDALKQVGISIALDDFGMGYSSLSYLHNLPIQKVKLDASFVRQLEADPSAIALVASIVQMTHIMRKDLVIEGVETAEQLALVAGAQARLIQGYYFSKPLAQADVIAFITHKESERRFDPRGEAKAQRAERRARSSDRHASRRV